MPIGFHPGRGCDVYSLGPRPTFAPFGGAEIKLISIRLVSFRPSERCRDFLVSHSYKHLTPTGVRIAGLDTLNALVARRTWLLRGP